MCFTHGQKWWAKRGGEWREREREREKGERNCWLLASLSLSLPSLPPSLPPSLCAYSPRYKSHNGAPTFLQPVAQCISARASVNVDRHYALCSPVEERVGLSSPLCLPLVLPLVLHYNPQRTLPACLSLPSLALALSLSRSLALSKTALLSLPRRDTVPPP